jgi:hypothetical protein
MEDREIDCRRDWIPRIWKTGGGKVFFGGTSLVLVGFTSEFMLLWAYLELSLWIS